MTLTKPALVGLFVLGGAALGVIALLLFAGTRFFAREVHAVTYFQGSVEGLVVGAPVTFRGVRVGSVTRIGVNINLTNLSARIPVYLTLDPSDVSMVGQSSDDSSYTFRRLRKAGLQARLEMQSLVTGQLAVDLELRPGVPATLLGGDVSGDEIPSSPSSLQTLEAEIADLPLKQISDNANKALESIRRITDTLEPRVGPLVDSLKRASDSAHVTMDAADVAVTHIDGLAVEGKQQLTVNGDQLQHVLASADRAASDADTLIVSVNTMTAPNSRMRDDLQSTLRDLAASASSLRSFTHEIERDPSDLVRRGKPP
jgi:paraquat-inducible protein B